MNNFTGRIRPTVLDFSPASTPDLANSSDLSIFLFSFYFGKIFIRRVKKAEAHSSIDCVLFIS